MGCGVGNTTIPILQENIEKDKYFIYSCDFSPKAIELLKNHKSYDTQKCHAFVFDISITPWCQLPFEEFSLDFATIIFVLSAIKPDKLPYILHELYRFMKPGGVVFFRDYGRYDLAQLRLKAGQCIGDNFYVRGDGTQVHFFTKGKLYLKLTSIFCTAFFYHTIFFSLITCKIRQIFQKRSMNYYFC